MRKIIKITENDLEKIIGKVLQEQGSMFGVSGADLPGYRRDDFRNKPNTQKVVTPRVKNINPKNLKVGARGEDVKKLQSELIKLGFLKLTQGPTGYFGPITQKALDKYNDSKGKPTKTIDSKIELPSNLKGVFLDCVKNSPKGKIEKIGKSSYQIVIDSHIFFSDQTAKLPDGQKVTYFCFEDGVKLKKENGKTTKLSTGVETNYEKTGTFSGGFKGMLRRMFPNVAELIYTRPLTEKDFSESQKEVIYNAIQNSITKRGNNRLKGCVEYIDYGKLIDASLNRTGGATTIEMALGTAASDTFRVATLLGGFCYELQPNGNYFIDDPYDFHKWKSFTVKKEEIAGMDLNEKISYIRKKTGLSPYGALRHIGWLEHPDNAPAASKTKLTLNINPGVFAKKDSKAPSSDSSSDNMV